MNKADFVADLEEACSFLTISSYLEDDDEPSLHNAGDAEMVEELLKAGADVDGLDEEGFTPLFVAVIACKDVTVTRALLTNGANVNARTRMNDTVLHLATEPEIVEELLLFNPDVNCVNYFLHTPLHVAVEKRKDISIIKMLLEHGADVNAKDAKQNTPLLIAISKGESIDYQSVRQLLTYEADIYSGGYTSALYAATQRNVICSKLLIKYDVLKNSDCLPFQVYSNIININDVCFLSTVLFRFIKECLEEIGLMKKDKFNNVNTVFELIKNKNIKIKPLYVETQDKLKEVVKNYPIYTELIWPKMTLFIDRGQNMNCLKGTNFSTVVKYNKEQKEVGRVTLNNDCIDAICEYLSNDDIINCATAFFLIW